MPKPPHADREIHAAQVQLRPKNERGSSAPSAELETPTHTLAQQLETKLHELTESSADEAHLVVQSGPVYLIFCVDHTDDSLKIEAVASHRLPPRHKLTVERAKEMRAQGFSKSSGQRNWQRRTGVDRASLRKAAHESEDILARLYGCDQQIEVLLVEDERHPPSNPDLLEAMRNSARQRDENSRHRLYNALVNTLFLVPLRMDTKAPRDDNDDSDIQFLVMDTSKGKPIYGAFSDWQALRLWQPLGWDYREIHGSVLFQRLAETNIVGFQINPNGDIGGELYRHEIEMLAMAVRAHRKQHAN